MYKLPENCVNQKVGDELVILDLDSGKYFGLDEVGARMVELIDEHGEVDKVVAKMLDEYDAGEEQLKTDLEELLLQLISHDLLIKQ